MLCTSCTMPSRTSILAFHPEGRKLASGGQQPGAFKVWDLTRPAEYSVADSFGAELADIEALTFSADDTELVVSGLCGFLGKWNTVSGQVTKGTWIPTARDWLVPATRSVFLDGGRQLATVSEGNNTLIQIWDLANRRLLREFPHHTAPVWHIAPDQSGRRAVSAAVGSSSSLPLRKVKLWEIATGHILWSATTTGERTLAAALSPYGAWVAKSRKVLGGSPLRGDVTLTPIEKGVVAIALAVPSGFVQVLSFNADGSLLAGATDSGLVVIWETKTGRALHGRPLEAGPGIGMLAFHPDGTRLAGVNRERVLIWDVVSGQVLLFLRGAPQRPSDNGFNPRIAWSHDGTQLAASSWDRTVSVWDSADLTTDTGRALLHRHADSRAFALHLEGLERHGDGKTP